VAASRSRKLRPLRGRRGARRDRWAMDDAEYERLLDMYDVSFKNFAEG
jgi:hypothetical protein